MQNYEFTCWFVYIGQLYLTIWTFYGFLYIFRHWRKLIPPQLTRRTWAALLLLLDAGWMLVVEETVCFLLGYYAGWTGLVINTVLVGTYFAMFAIKGPLTYGQCEAPMTYTSSLIQIDYERRQVKKEYLQIIAELDKDHTVNLKKVFSRKNYSLLSQALRGTDEEIYRQLRATLDELCFPYIYNLDEADIDSRDEETYQTIKNGESLIREYFDTPVNENV